jgi:hypothetical protein
MIESLERVAAEWLQGSPLPGRVERTRLDVDPQRLRSILALVGPRRAGKTFTLYQLIDGLMAGGRAERGDILLVDFEDYRLKGFEAADMDALLGAHERLAGRAPKYLFLDEIQQAGDWSRLLRTLHNRGSHRIVVTGSNSRLLAREVATELRGRYESVLVLPFSYQEFLRFKGLDSTPVRARSPGGSAALAGAFQDWLRHGGYPEVCLRETALERRRLLQSYFESVVYRDVLDRHPIRARGLLDDLLAWLLEAYSTTFSVGAFERRFKAGGRPASKATISAYLGILEEVFFLVRSRRFGFSPRSRLFNPTKTYLIDTGFAGLGGAFTENRGRLLENAVAIELKRRGRDPLYFADRHECDFILRDGPRVDAAIQVCWEINPASEERELRGLAEALRATRAPKAAILTFDQEGERVVEGRRVPLLPAWRWMAGLDDF